MCGPNNSFVSWTAWPNGRKPEYQCLSGFFFFVCFGSNTEIPEKEGQETEGVPAAVRVHFFTTSIWSIRNCTLCSEIQLWLCCLSTGLDLYLCRWSAGGCNADFIVAIFAIVCVLMALPALPLAGVLLLLMLLTGEEWTSSFISLLFQAVLWNSVFHLAFFQCWFLLLEGKFQAA